MLAGADARMLASIREGLNLDAGLSQIVGAPPRQEPRPPSSYRTLVLEVADLANVTMCGGISVTVTQSGDVSSQLANLRLRILALAKKQDAGAPVFGEATVALLRGAASNLKDLNRGLDARELSRSDAAALLDETERALTLARATADRSASTPDGTLDIPPDESSDSPPAAKTRLRGWRRLTAGARWAAVLATAGLQASAIAAGHYTRLASIALGGMCALGVALLVTSMAKADTVELARDADQIQRVARKFLRRRALVSTFISKIDALDDELRSVRPEVMKLFDEADDCSPCTPHR
jgi:hypothetical protein